MGIAKKTMGNQQVSLTTETKHTTGILEKVSIAIMVVGGMISVAAFFSGIILTTTEQTADTTSNETSSTIPADFTVIALPDTQYYSESYPNIFTAQTEWIRDHYAALNTQFVTHVGDVVDEAPSTTQWNRAVSSLGVLDAASIPYAIAIGNHDYNTVGSRNAGTFNSRFNVANYNTKSWWGGSFDPNSYVNNYEFFSGGGIDFMIMHLEFCPRNAVLDWADTVIENNKDKKVLIITHSYMNGNGQRMQPGVTWDCAHYGLGAPNGNDGEQQWAWYKKHRNVFMVLSGHMDTTGYLKGMGDSGNDIHQMLSDYQSYGNGGNGYLRIIRFSPQTNTVNIKTYSPTLNQYIPAHEYQFDFFPYDSFKAEYYNNKDMSGVPAYTTTVSTINSDWGNSTPHPAVTSDRFSARWTGYWDLNAGQYNFIMTTDDGMRVYVDGELITGLDKWFDQAETTYVVPVTIANSGRHEIYVEYYEDLGTAKARLYWTNVPDTLAPILSNLSPFSGATSVSANTNISLHVTDSAYGVDKSSLGMTVNGSAVTPVVTGTPSDYLIVYNPPSDFTSPQNVQVHIEAQDLAGNTLSQSYSFQVGCVPACIGKVCGSDGCGGSCGDCSAGTICSGESCVPCTPNCTGKICGSNGCGGSCGSCSSEMSCSAGQCITNPSGGGIIKPCFLAGTSIGLAYGGTKPIEQIAVGDEVVSFDEMSQTFQKSMVKELFVHETDYYLVINNFINVTPNHAVYSGGKWVPIGDLIVGDTIYSSGEKALTIISIEKVEAPVTVYNFEAYPYHTYIADGIVAHNALGKKPPAE